jgi:SAM-dependent methyltransferase
MGMVQSILKALEWRLNRFIARVKVKQRLPFYLCRSWYSLVVGQFNVGCCPICERRTLFIKEKSWLRDHYCCIYCRSIPRWRAIIHVLQIALPGWRQMKIYESSPGGASSEKLTRECLQYIPTHFFTEIEPGTFRNGIRCENLEHLTFSDESFDLVITQDVLEHVLDPVQAFAEIARVLVPGGSHVFTVPYYRDRKTLTRAVRNTEGIEYLRERIYHGNPIDSRGSLVVTDWGNDMGDFIFRHTGMITTQYRVNDRTLGLDGEFLEVFVSY